MKVYICMYQPFHDNDTIHEVYSNREAAMEWLRSVCTVRGRVKKIKEYDDGDACCYEGNDPTWWVVSYDVEDSFTPAP